MRGRVKIKSGLVELPPAQRANPRVDLHQPAHQVLADGELLGAPQLLLRLKEAARLELQLGQIEADARLETGLARGPLQPGQRLAVCGSRRLLPPQLHVELTLGVRSEERR